MVHNISELLFKVVEGHVKKVLQHHRGRQQNSRQPFPVARIIIREFYP